LNDLECPNDYIFRRISGYVDQEDIHLPNLTVRETLEFSAAVRLPEAIGDEEKKNKVVSVMKQLGLLHIADSRVGDALRRGISGGEKKRLSIAVELVTDPAVLFIDEPTSGLDSYNALQVVQTLANLAKESKKTVFTTEYFIIGNFHYSSAQFYNI
jgi:ABC-type multidrug transport system ATPase subunit